MLKKISVVIPTYKRLNLLINCLAALKKQTIPLADYEVIVVSDGPDKETEKFLCHWLNRHKMDLRFLSTGTKNGPAAARNLGWLSARAPIIAFTDDDCLPDRNWLKCILKGYRDEELIAFGGKTVVPITKNPTDFELNTARLATADFITANCACTKKALIKVGGFDEAFKMAWREDSDLEFKLMLEKIPIYRNSDAIVVHPVRQARWGASIFEQKKGVYDALLYKKYPVLYRQKIQAKPLFLYYSVLATGLLSVGLILAKQDKAAKITLLILGIQLLVFTYQRLKPTKKSISHILEMSITSMLIPFISLYWRFYGAVKFKKLLI